MSGTVKVWDPRQKDDPVANMEPVKGENKRDCWTVAFGKLLKDLTLKHQIIKSTVLQESPDSQFRISSVHYSGNLSRRIDMVIGPGFEFSLCYLLAL